MGKVRDEIRLYAAEENKPILDWLLDHYSSESQFMFLATCKFERYGIESYKVHRVWQPTKEGRLIYRHRDELLPYKVQP